CTYRGRIFPDGRGLLRIYLLDARSVYQHERAVIQRGGDRLPDRPDLRTGHRVDVQEGRLKAASTVGPAGGHAAGAGTPTLLVLTSTYPRWAGDPEPGFVHELAKRLTDRFRVIVLGPHAPGAKTAEVLDGVEVIRYRYAPERMETLVNDGGIITNLRRSRWKYLLVPG